MLITEKNIFLGFTTYISAYQNILQIYSNLLPAIYRNLTPIPSSTFDAAVYVLYLYMTHSLQCIVITIYLYNLYLLRCCNRKGDQVYILKFVTV